MGNIARTELEDGNLWVKRVVEARMGRKKSLLVDFRWDGERDSRIRRVGQFRIDKVQGFEILQDYIYIYLPGGYVCSDRNPELEEKLNNLHLYIK